MGLFWLSLPELPPVLVEWFHPLRARDSAVVMTECSAECAFGNVCRRRRRSRAASWSNSQLSTLPSLSSRSLECCAAVAQGTTLSLRRSQLQKLPSSARSSALNAVRTRRYFERSPVCVAFGFFAVPSHAGSIPFSNHTSLHPRASCRAVNPPNGSLC